MWAGSSQFSCGVAVADMKFTKAPGRDLEGGCNMVVCRFINIGNVAPDIAFAQNRMCRMPFASDDDSVNYK